jgi:hypothetical protein
MSALPEADPEVAAATLARDLDAFWVGGRPHRIGMERRRLDGLRWVITIPATRANGHVDPFHLRVDGRHYDLYPVDARLVVPPESDHDVDGWGWPEAQPGTRWWPTFDPYPPGIRLHPRYRFTDGTSGQLLCFSFTAGYYISNHNPSVGARWQQGRHTVAATITRLHEALQQPYYRRPSDTP